MDQTQKMALLTELGNSSCSSATTMSRPTALERWLWNRDPSSDWESAIQQHGILRYDAFDERPAQRQRNETERTFVAPLNAARAAQECRPYPIFYSPLSPRPAFWHRYFMPIARLKRSLRTTFLGLATNTLLAAAKLLAGIFGHSHALIADAIESLADVFSSIIVWRGVVLAAEPADEDHPYGHGKAEPIAAAVVSGMLLLAALWIIVSAFRGVAEPHAAPRAFTLIVLFVVIGIKESLFRFVLREATSLDSSAVATDAWHHRSDAITSFAAAIGITVALIGGPGYESADDWAAIAAGCVIAWNGWRLLRPAMNELMDRSPNREVIDHIRKVAETVPDVQRVEKCLVRQMGYQYFVDMHVEVDPQMTVLRSHEIAHRVKDAVRETVPRVRDVLVHIEPLNVSAPKK